MDGWRDGLLEAAARPGDLLIGDDESGVCVFKHPACSSSSSLPWTKGENGRRRRRNQRLPPPRRLLFSASPPPGFPSFLWAGAAFGRLARRAQGLVFIQSVSSGTGPPYLLPPSLPACLPIKCPCFLVRARHRQVGRKHYVGPCVSDT